MLNFRAFSFLPLFAFRVFLIGQIIYFLEKFTVFRSDQNEQIGEGLAGQGMKAKTETKRVFAKIQIEGRGCARQR